MQAPQGEVRERKCTHGGGPEGQPGSLWATLAVSGVPTEGEAPGRRHRSVHGLRHLPYRTRQPQLSHWAISVFSPPRLLLAAALAGSEQVGEGIRAEKRPQLQGPEPELGKEKNFELGEKLNF